VEWARYTAPEIPVSTYLTQSKLSPVTAPIAPDCANGLTAGHEQERTAELLGIPVGFLSLIEHGSNAPSFETLDPMGKRLRLPVPDLFEFDGKLRS
jgi:transcriptional regulator with XRE-family HTH domain